MNKELAHATCDHVYVVISAVVVGGGDRLRICGLRFGGQSGQRPHLGGYVDRADGGGGRGDEH